MSYLKPQNPIKLNNDYIYPLTTADQVITGSGERLNSLFKKTIKENTTLQVANWSDTKPYTQTITISESTDDYNVDANVAYSDGDNAALHAAAGCISYIKKNHKEITFYCLKNKPEVDIPVEITGTCRNTIATVEEGIKLNFDIVGGTTQPVDPIENTIWVNTDVPIVNWIFSINKKPVSTCFRFIKLQMNALQGSGSTVQISDIRFVDDDGGFFVYPSGTTASSSIAAASTGENETKLIDNNASTKYCSTQWVSGSYILIDFGVSNFIDMKKYKRWQWYTASDATTYPDRNLRDFSLWGSNDGTTFELLDSITNYNVPSQNSAVAYTGTIDVQQEESANGCVWITIGDNSNVEFNALQNNIIHMCPKSAYQYINGAWIEKTAMSYQNSEWKEWSAKLYLYNAGNTCDSVTGGWGSTTNQGNVTFSSDTVTLTVTNNGYNRASIYIKKKIDLTDYKTLCVHYKDTKGRTNNYGCQVLQVGDNLNVGSGWAFLDMPTTMATANVTQQDFTLLLDISEVNRSSYISTTIDSEVSGAYGIIDKIWLE